MKTAVREKFLPVSLPTIEEGEIAEVVDSLKSGWITTGPKVQKFEEKFRRYTGAKHAVALNSGTAALHVSYLAAGVKPGDEVITTPLTFAATVNMILLCGAKPVLVDIDSKTLNIDPAKIEKAVTKKTRAIVPVHFAGLPCDMEGIGEIARRRGLMVIEDAAHAVGTLYRGKQIGTISPFTCFSFHPMKNITTGEGGLVTVADETVAERLKALRFHGIAKDAWKRYDKKGSALYDVQELGFKYNMLDLQAAIGLHQLDKLERFIARREEIARQYREAFADLDAVLLPPEAAKGDRHAWHLYPVQFKTEKLGKEREKIIEELKAENIGAGIHYVAIHRHSFFAKTLGYKTGDLPAAEYVSDRVLSLPLFPSMTDQDVADVAAAVKKVAG